MSTYECSQHLDDCIDYLEQKIQKISAYFKYVFVLTIRKTTYHIFVGKISAFCGKDFSSFVQDC